MNQKHSLEEKRSIVNRYRSGESVASISSDSMIPRSTIYAWLKEAVSSGSRRKAMNIKNFHALEKQVMQLQGIIEIMKKSGCQPNAPLADKLSALELLYGQYSVHMLCEALDVPRGTFYNHIFRNKRTNTLYIKRREELRTEIQRIYDENRQVFGAGKIHAILKEKGVRVSQEMVLRLMRDLGLVSIRQGAKGQYDKEKNPYKNYLKQQFSVSRPNEVWVSDVTYYRLNGKDYYLCAVLDLYARRIIGYKIGFSNSTQLVRSTFQAAYKDRNPQLPLTLHTDRGSNYRSKTFCSLLRSLGVIQSFSNAHTPYDNSVMESFFSNLKREELYRTKYRSEREFRTAVDQYMVFYNEQRPHAKNKYKTPAGKEAEYVSNDTAL